MIVLPLALALLSVDLSAAEIIARATQNNAFGFGDAVATLTLTLHKVDGETRTRQAEVRSRNINGALHTRVRFLAPPEVAGAGFLVRENKSGDDDQYLYLPALAKTKRITGRQRDEKFMGSDLSYADIQAKEVRSAVLKRLPDGVLGGKPVLMIEATPQDPQSSLYSKTVTWVQPEYFVALKVEFFDKQEALRKVLTVSRLEKRAGHWVATQSQMRDVQAGTFTDMRIDNIAFDQKFSAEEFTPEALAGG